MPKLYLKYAEAALLGLVASGPVVFLTPRVALAACLEVGVAWDLRSGEAVGRLADDDNSAEVTAVARAATGVVALGYGDGRVRLFRVDAGGADAVLVATLAGHRAAVCALAFDASCARLASAGRDTDVVVWDVVGERGLFRLRGHKDLVSAVAFVEHSPTRCNHLVSASKDSSVKLWDLNTNHCVETVVAHRGEVGAMALVPAASSSPPVWSLVTGGSEGEVRVWKLHLQTLSEKLEPVDNGAISSSYNPDGMELDDAELAQDAATAKTLKKSLVFHGLLERQSKERVLNIKVHDSLRYLVVQGSDRIAEIYKIRTAAELQKREARLKRRNKEKNKTGGEEAEEHSSLLTIADEIPRISAIRCGAKIKSIDISPATASSLSTSKETHTFQIICTLTSNQIEVHTAGIDSKDEPTRQDIILDAAGHRNDIRTLALNSDDTLLLSGSHTAVKLWSIESRKCLATMESGYALCSSFIPGNNHVIVGTKTGELQIFQLGSHTMIENIQAHEGAIWSLQVWPDRRGITTGSADKDVKFWEFALVEDVNGGAAGKKLTLTHVRTLKLSEDVLCVRHSHDGKLLAVSLLDSTIKVFYADTLKFFLSLYGHTLPVLSMDISSDGTLIATGSADKSVKLWGLDFGDCHRSLRAHEDSVMAVKWIFGTHYLVTAGKDKLVKWWDADKFEQIMKVQGHHGEVWALAVGKYGSIVVSGSHDRSIRIWEKTDEQFAIEEERELELEEMFEKNQLDEEERNNAQAIGSGVLTDADIDGTSKSIGAIGTKNEQTEVGDAARKTTQTLLAGEKIISAMDIWEEETEKLQLDAAALKKWQEENAKKGAADTLDKTPAVPPPKPEPRNPYILAAKLDGYPPEAYVLYVVEGIRSGDLEQALLVLPFLKVVELLKILLVWVQKEWNTAISSRVLHHILQTHQNEIVTSRVCRPILLQLKTLLPATIRKERDAIGFNLAGLKYMKREWDASHSLEFLDAIGVVADEKNEEKGKSNNNSKNKRKRVVVVSR